MEIRWGYSLSVLEGFINAKAGDPEASFTILDRQIALGIIERLEHIALALENLSDVGDVVASKLTFGTVPGEGSYADGAPGPLPGYAEKAAAINTVAGGFGPATREDLAERASAAMPFCDAPGCKEPVAHHGVVDGIGRRVCVIHAGMLNANPDTVTPPETPRPFVVCDVTGCQDRASHSVNVGKPKSRSYCEKHIGEGVHDAK